MIDSLLVNNFRGFEHLELHGLKRVNVLVGPNASGKTALLESIFLAAGVGPENALRLYATRGAGQALQISYDRTSYEALWSDLFFGRDQRKTITVNLLGTPEANRSVSISYAAQGSLVPIGKEASESSFIVPITFVWRDHAGQVLEAQAKISKDGLMLPTIGESFPTSFFSSTMSPHPAEAATRYSQLDVQGKSGSVVHALRQLFPFVRELSIQVVSGTPILHASVDHLAYKVPLGMLSGGIQKLASILLGTSTGANSVVLIDEVENGVYYELLPRMWSVLLDTSRRCDSQVFASTHSEECLKALSEAIRGNENEFALIRTDRKDGRCVARGFDGSQLESAIRQDIEVR